MITFDITMTLKEAEAISLMITKTDPLLVFTGDLVKRIENQARKAMSEKKTDPIK